MSDNSNSEDLIRLIKSLILNKTNLLQLLEDKKGVKLSKHLTYDKIISRVGEKELRGIWKEDVEYAIIDEIIEEYRDSVNFRNIIVKMRACDR